MVAVTLPTVVEVVTVKVADFRPAGTVTQAGTTAFALFEERLTFEPPAGATAYRVTVPVDDCPPTTVLGENVSETSVAGLMMSVAVSV